MWRLLGVILIFQPNVVLGKLVGDHICLAEESYSANVTEYHVRNATVRSYQWCMNFPPRCSFYTTRKINETKSVEKKLTRIIEVCCEGFKEKNNRCISKCHECTNGICENEKCICSSGYIGPTCEVACDEGLWGKNCSLRCNCKTTQCNPINGNCILNTPETTTTTSKPTTHLTLAPTTSTEIKTESTTVSFNEQFTNITEININSTTLTETSDIVTSTVVSRISGNIEATKSIYSKEQTYYTTPYITTKTHVPSSSFPKFNYKTTTPSQTKLYESATTIPIIRYQVTSPRTTQSFVPSSTIPILKYQTMPPITKVLEASEATPTLSYPPISSAEIEVIGPSIPVLRNESTTTTSIPKTTSKVYASKKTQVPRLGNEYKEILIPVEIKYEPIKKHSYKKDTLSTTPNNFDDDKNYSNIENVDYINGHVSSEKYNTINHVSSIAGTTILITAILVISLIGIHNIRRSRTTKNEVEKERSCPAVALYTTSIFHTPLPDPPTFDNPTYITPAEYRKSPTEQITFKAHIICGNRNLDLANEIKDCREYVYDHPPSTGSYRAASTIEPSEMNLSQSLTTLEPVYDEIPNRIPEITETNLNYTIQDVKPSTIYINTCGRTKF